MCVCFDRRASHTHAHFILSTRVPFFTGFILGTSLSSIIFPLSGHKSRHNMLFEHSASHQHKNVPKQHLYLGTQTRPKVRLGWTTKRMTPGEQRQQSTQRTGKQMPTGQFVYTLPALATSGWWSAKEGDTGGYTGDRTTETAAWVYY